jgi:HD-GYP domain-containing protein (c-di-GMP phosphodiesterase class II)
MMDNNQQLNEIIRLGEELNSIQDLDFLLEKILFKTRTFLNSDAGSIQIKENDELVFSHVQTDSIQRSLPPGQKLIYTTFRTKISKNSISGYVAITGELLNIPDAYNIPPDAPYRFDPTNDKKSGFKTKSILTIPLKNNRKEILGVMQIVNALRPDASGNLTTSCAENGCFNADDEHLAIHFANSASMILQRAQMTRDLILRMISMAELRDPKETGPHVNRVAALSVEIYENWAKRKNIPEEEIDHNKDIFRMAAMLHDVGKVGISDLILKKPAKLTEDEYEIMKCHTYIGARLFGHMHSEFDEMASVVAVNHHENWDGSGYPGFIDVKTGLPEKTGCDGKVTGKKGEEIPIYGRIVALADVYDALSSKRVYKEAWSEEDVMNELKKDSGIKFDPELIEIFFENYTYFKSIAGRYPEV